MTEVALTSHQKLGMTFSLIIAYTICKIFCWWLRKICVVIFLSLLTVMFIYYFLPFLHGGSNRILPFCISYVLDGPDIYMNFDESTTGGSLIGYKLTGSPINGAGLVTDHFKSGKALYLDGKWGIAFFRKTLGLDTNYSTWNKQ